MGKVTLSPWDFITLARRLGNNQDEVSLRSAVSLAYYGAFHFAGEQLERLSADSADPFRWTGARKSHSGLRNQWAERLGTTGDLVASNLFHAHELRTKADYDLHLVFTPEDKEAFGFVAQVLLAVRRGS